MLTGTSTREQAWGKLTERWDLIIVGGGITGAGILREAVRVGLRVLLLEQGDFSSGTSSRSSKLVHGGLRYLNNAQFGLTWQSVRERDELLKEGPGLVERLPFLYPFYRGDRLPGWVMEIGLSIYSLMAGKWHDYRSLGPQELLMMAPGLSAERLTGGLRFFDAQTDDARLVLRLIREGARTGRAVAINYARVEGLLRDEAGKVSGVTVRDRETGREYHATAAAVINATGVWADRLRGEVGAPPHMRPLRGSHLVFSQHRFPLFQAATFPHPDDGRPVFAFPWEGVTLLGTTDLDHRQGLDQEPTISREEIDYLLGSAQAHFPGLGLDTNAVMATFAGVRPVISHGQEVDPSKEGREHVIWNESGLLTVTGGKLTTFRCIALDALRALHRELPAMKPVSEHLAALDPAPRIDKPLPGLTAQETLRLAARYGEDILGFAAEAPAAERERIGALPVHWLEFRWAARHEAVLHLDDLLLRRVRIGLLVPEGGAGLLTRIRLLAQPELGWANDRWEQEAADYLTRWHAHYSPPATILSPSGDTHA